MGAPGVGWFVHGQEVLTGERTRTEHVLVATIHS